MYKLRKISHTSKVSKTRIINRKSLKSREIPKTQINAMLPITVVLTLIGLWLSLCYSSNLFINEALVCSSIIVSIVFFRAAEQNGDLKSNGN